MTINPYFEQIKKHCPETYIGLISYLNRVFNNDRTKLNSFLCSNIYIVNPYIIGYIEYRQVNFLESMCNTHYDNIDLSFNDLVGKTITNTLYRLEKNLIPLEGQPF